MSSHGNVLVWHGFSVENTVHFIPEWAQEEAIKILYYSSVLAWKSQAQQDSC